MPLERKLVNLIFRDNSNRPELEPLCGEVLKHFQLPQRSLICIFDDEERPVFLDSLSLGMNYCGFFVPVRKFGRCFQWPQPILNHAYNSDWLDPEPKGWRCDVVIYLWDRTCNNSIGTVITFAHELQHFMQYGHNYKTWRADGLVKEVYPGEPMAPWRLPCEYEAQLISKRVANGILGVDVVTNYAEQKIQEENDPEKWSFFQGLDPEESFNLLDRTKPWVNEYREVLKERFPAQSSEAPDFIKDNWWE
jgi:hypothetical protein